MKANMEVIVALISLFAWTQHLCAPAFPIFYIMMLRLKASVNTFTKRSYDNYDALARSVLPAALYKFLVDDRRSLWQTIGGVSLVE